MSNLRMLISDYAITAANEENPNWSEIIDDILIRYEAEASGKSGDAEWQLRGVLVGLINSLAVSNGLVTKGFDINSPSNDLNFSEFLGWAHGLRLKAPITSLLKSHGVALSGLTRDEMLHHLATMRAEFERSMVSSDRVRAAIRYLDKAKDELLRGDAPRLHPLIIVATSIALLGGPEKLSEVARGAFDSIVELIGFDQLDDVDKRLLLPGREALKALPAPTENDSVNSKV